MRAGRRRWRRRARHSPRRRRSIAIPGDVTDAQHRALLADAARQAGGLDLLVNNASILGPSPQPALLDYPLDVLERVYRTNVIAPLALIQAVRPVLNSGARIVNITSDAAVEPYAGWGGYGSSKAALAQLSNILAAENPALRVYWVDPGDMRTQMHQEAFPGEDISDRPLPETSVPGLLALIAGGLPSGRYAARALAATDRGRGRIVNRTYQERKVPMTATTLTRPPAVDAPRFRGSSPLILLCRRNSEAREPPEARGLARDDVRLLVSSRADDRITHARFRDLPDFLHAGDLLVINTSGTLSAAVLAARADGTVVEVHLSTRLPGDLWAVELRTPAEGGTAPLFTGMAGETLRLPAGGALTLLTPYRPDQRGSAGRPGAALDRDARGAGAAARLP